MIKFVSVATEAVPYRFSLKKASLEISQNSQENTCARIPFLIKLHAYFAKFLRTPFVTEHLRWMFLLLNNCKATLTLC